MLGDQSGLESLDDFVNPLQMITIERLCTAKRKTDAVQRDRIIAPDRFQIRSGGAAAHVVLGMNLEPSDIGTRGDDGLMVLKAQSDPRSSRYRAALPRCRKRGGCALYGHAEVFPPWILAQSPAGSSTNDFGSRA